MRTHSRLDKQDSTLTGTHEKTLVVALAGQPNVGKSTIFNYLTGLSQHVGNWPGKTVEQKTGTALYDGRRLSIVDLPGTYSLTANSEEERIARDFIIREAPDVVVAVVDAALPERSLYLLSELLLLPAPVVLVLNMMDVAAQEGIRIEPHVLEAALGIPVVPMVATKGKGLGHLLQAVVDVAEGRYPYTPRRPTILPGHQEVLQELITTLADYVPAPYPVEWVALKLLEGDEEIDQLVRREVPPDVYQKIHKMLLRHEDAVLDIAGARYEWIERMIRAAVVRPTVGAMGLTARLDTFLTHPLWGVLALSAVLAGVFALTYTLGSPLQEWLGDMLQVAMESLREWVTRGLGAPVWLGDMLADGVLGGMGMVITFLPILLIFFAVLALLEDTGYLARAAYVTDRAMHALGLHGKSFLPLLLGFGCNVPAVLGSRIIETPRARILTILLAPLVPCAARMAVLTVLSAVFFGKGAAIVTIALVIGNLVALVGLGFTFNRFVLKGERSVFIMELPLYHLPNLRTIGLYVWHNVVAFLKKAGSTILLASLVVWGLSYFPIGSDVTQSYLGKAGQFLAPVGRLMGLPWPILIALFTSFVAKENTIATLSVLYGDFSSVLPEILSGPAALAFLVVQMLFVPCVATVAAMRQELRSWKWTAVGVGALLFLSVGAGVIVYQVGSLLVGG